MRRRVLSATALLLATLFLAACGQSRLVRELEDRNALLEGRVVELRDDLATAQRSVSGLEGEVRRLEGELSSVRGEVVAVADEVRVVRVRLDEALQEVAALTEERDRLRDRLAAALSQGGEAAERRAALGQDGALAVGLEAARRR